MVKIEPIFGSMILFFSLKYYSYSCPILQNSIILFLSLFLFTYKFSNEFLYVFVICLSMSPKRKAQNRCALVLALTKHPNKLVLTVSALSFMNMLFHLISYPNIPNIIVIIDVKNVYRNVKILITIFSQYFHIYCIAIQCTELNENKTNFSNDVNKEITKEFLNLLDFLNPRNRFGFCQT